MIKLNTGKIIKKQHNFWNNFHFHPTDAIEDEWGQKVLNQAAHDKAADTVRMYAMLEDIVTADADGNLCYDFTLNDARIDYMLSRGYNLLISYNFIPACITEENDQTNTEVNASSRYKGKTLVTALPRDWSLWEEICYEYTKHIVERYGIETVSNWYLQCYNEPDARGFFLRKLGLGEEALKKRCEEYVKMYAAFEKATRRVSEKLKIGGPAASGKTIFDYFLKYTKANNLKVDFTCAHSYGTNPDGLNSNKRPIGVQNNIKAIKGYIEKLNESYPEGLELIMDEWGAAGAGFCNLENCPKLIFRETELFAAFFGQLIIGCIEQNVEVSKLMICLSGSHQPHQYPGRFIEFNGFRSFFTEHFVAKPIYNAYVLARHLKENIIEAECDNENVKLLPTTDGKNYSIMLTYSTPDFDESLTVLNDKLTMKLNGHYKVTQWCIDKIHTNPYRLWERENMPAFPSEKQLDELRAEGILKPYRQTEINADGDTELNIQLGRNGFMMIDIDEI